MPPLFYRAVLLLVAVVRFWMSWFTQTSRTSSQVPSSAPAVTRSHSGLLRGGRENERTEMDAAETEAEAHAPEEADRVLSHVEEMFRQLGFNEFQAIAFADARADWHRADNLIKNGCSHELVVEILL